MRAGQDGVNLSLDMGAPARTFEETCLKEVLVEGAVTGLKPCPAGETPFWSIGCSFPDGGLVVSSIADSSTEFDVRQANSYAMAKGEKEMVDEQERQEGNTRT